MITECTIGQLNTSTKYINSNSYLILQTEIIFRGIKESDISFRACKNLEGIGIVVLSLLNGRYICAGQNVIEEILKNN